MRFDEAMEELGKITIEKKERNEVEEAKDLLVDTLGPLWPDGTIRNNRIYVLSSFGNSVRSI